MHPHGHICGFGNYPKWSSRLYPFKDRPDVGIDVIWYAVPEDRPHVPPTVFTDRFWEQTRPNHPWRTGVGSGLDWKVYTGPLPEIPLEPYEGTPDQWANGLLYTTWIAGGYSNRGPCVPVPITDHPSILVSCYDSIIPPSHYSPYLLLSPLDMVLSPPADIASLLLGPSDEIGPPRIQEASILLSPEDEVVPLPAEDSSVLLAPSDEVVSPPADESSLLLGAEDTA